MRSLPQKARGPLQLPRLAGFYLLIFGVALGALLWQGHLDRLGPIGAGIVTWMREGATGVGLGLLLVGASRFAERHFRWARVLSEEFRVALGPMDRQTIVAAAILSGVAEEALFRAVLQPALGLWVAAAIFGLLHVGPNPRFVPWTVMAFVVGVLFGGLFAWYGNAWACMWAHALVNLLNLDALARERPVEEVQLGTPGASYLVLEERPATSEAGDDAPTRSLSEPPRGP